MEVKKKRITILILCMIIIGSLIIFNDQKIQINSAVPTWRGVELGDTTQEEVISLLGQPVRVLNCKTRNGQLDLIPYLKMSYDCKFNQRVIFEYQDVFSENPDLPLIQEIHFRESIVELIVEDVLPIVPLEILKKNEDTSGLTLNQLINSYGVPEYVTWSTRSPHYNALLYCEKGFIAHGNDNSIRWLYYFVPMTIDQCLNTYIFDTSQTNPFPNSDVVAIKDPWGFNKVP